MGELIGDTITLLIVLLAPLHVICVTAALDIARHHSGYCRYSGITLSMKRYAPA